jgi:putative FmdB family regulatory protein
MPLYEYECKSCSRRFERIQKFSDPPVEVCPACGGAVRKLLSSPAIQFKGSGWYVTDYAKKAAADKSKGAEPKTDAQGESKAEAKSESKSGPTKSESPATTSDKTTAPKP